MPSIEIKEVGEGKNLLFTASVTVLPEGELGQYKGIEIEKPDVNVTDEEVEAEIKKVAEKNARIMSVEDRGIQKGDLAQIDLKALLTESPLKEERPATIFLK